MTFIKPSLHQLFWDLAQAILLTLKVSFNYKTVLSSLTSISKGGKWKKETLELEDPDGILIGVILFFTKNPSEFESWAFCLKK